MAGEIIKTQGIVLTVHPWSRTSHVVTWLTPDHGPVTTLVKGAVRPKSAFLGQYDLFYTCDILYYARATADDPENVQRYAAEFAEMCLALHKVHVDTTAFESVKDRYFKLLVCIPVVMMKPPCHADDSFPSYRSQNQFPRMGRRG